MIFKTFGDKNKQAILLIHTLFTDADFFAPAVNVLAKDYFVITPTLTGHYPDSVYVSTADEIRQIEEYLATNAVTSLYAIAGFSLGGNLAYAFFCKHANRIEKAVIDSAPLFRLPRFVKNYYRKRYARCLRKIKSGTCDPAKELDKNFNGMGQYQKDIAPIVALESLSGLVESCFDTKVYRLRDIERDKVTFVYGSRDVARLCKVRLRHYRICNRKGYGHCGYYREDPIGWVKRFLAP